MKEDINKFLKLTGLPFRFVGVTLIEICLFVLATTGVIAACHYIFGPELVSTLVDIVILLWLFLISRRVSVSWSRFNDIDEREADFRDEMERRYERIEKNLDNES